MNTSPEYVKALEDLKAAITKEREETWYLFQAWSRMTPEELLTVGLRDDVAFARFVKRKMGESEKVIEKLCKAFERKYPD